MHTKGNWEVIEHRLSDKDYKFIRAGEGHYSKEGKDTGFEICGFIGLANAQLIASAPELLEELKELLKFTEAMMADTGCAPGDNQEYLIVDCKRAIQKAEGKGE